MSLPTLVLNSSKGPNGLGWLIHSNDSGSIHNICFEMEANVIYMVAVLKTNTLYKKFLNHALT